MFVVFARGNEVIVTTAKKEKQTLKEYFEKGGRYVSGYDRSEIEEIAVRFISEIRN